MIQYENNLKSLPIQSPIITGVISFEQGLTQAIFTLAANTLREKVSVQNSGGNPLSVFLAGQLISIIDPGIHQEISGSQARLAIGLSSPLGSSAIIASYLRG